VLGIIGQALFLAFVLGRQFDRLSNLDRLVGKIEREGTDALKVVAERQATVMRDVNDLKERITEVERSGR
jgi:hypothetical protein